MHRLAALACASLLLAGRCPAQPAPLPADADPFFDLFRPARTELAALSPDGAHLAYTVREGSQLSVMVVATDRLDQALARVAVVDDEQATPRFGRRDEPVPAAITWLKWTDAERVVLATNAHVAVAGDRSVPGVIMTFRRDGSDARVLATPRDVAELVGAVEPAASLARDQAMLGPTPDNPNFGRDEAEPALDPFAPGGLFAGGDDAAAPGQNPALDPATLIEQRPLSPSIFDLDPVSANHVLVRTRSDQRIVLHRLDVTTGRLTQQAEYAIDPGRHWLTDRQGVPRISVPATTATDFPHRLALERGAGNRGPRDLATAIGLEAGAFDLTPETTFGHRAIALGFDERPEILYFASNLGRDTYGLYAADLTRGTLTDFAFEHPRLDLIGPPTGAFASGGTLVFDRHTRALRGVRFGDRPRTTRWLDPVLQAAQAQLEQALPQRNVELIDWDRDQRRVLAFVSGPTEPGRFLLFDRSTRQVAEFASRAPWLADGPPTRLLAFTVTGPDGTDLACQITLPVQPRVKPTPIVVVCPTSPWERLSPEFQAEVHALARMGFAVLQYAGRGAWGYGVRHRAALAPGYDDTQLADLLAILDEVGKAFHLDPRRVGLVGSGHGGYLALRALAAHPDRFRCAVALEPPVNLAAWLEREQWEGRDPALQLVRSAYGPAAQLEAHRLDRATGTLTKPSLILSYPGEDGTWRRSTYTAARNLASAVRVTQPESEFIALSHDFARGLPRAKAAVYRSIETFLNTHVYTFDVKIGEAVEAP